MEGWRKVGDPAMFAQKYAEDGADELLFMDVVASLYNRNNLDSIVKNVASHIFIPMTVGGGIRSVEDVSHILACGADKVAINTAATQNPEIIDEISQTFGSQATVVSIEAVKSDGSWIAMTDNGRNHTGLEVVKWAQEAESRGAGELIITSVEKEGLGLGLDIDLIKKITDVVSIPVVVGGGVGSTQHVEELIETTDISAVSMAQALHWNKLSIADIRLTLESIDCFVREIA